MKKLLILFGYCIFVGCDNKINMSNHPTMISIETLYNDSLYKVNYEYKALEIDTMNYIITYKDTSDNEITTYVLYLGQSANYYTNNELAMKNKYIFEQQKSKTYTVNAKKYIIYSFLLDYREFDNAKRLFWCREFGFINFLNLSWYSNTYVHFFDNEKQVVVDCLNLQLMSDTVFYRYNDDLPPNDASL